jgi:endogenous inhibitor of DNA gyrase (YacG/DUF329 family)
MTNTDSKTPAEQHHYDFHSRTIPMSDCSDADCRKAAKAHTPNFEEIEDRNAHKVEHCAVCGKPVLMMIFRGSGLCSENCRKIRAGEPVEEEPVQKLHY